MLNGSHKPQESINNLTELEHGRNMAPTESAKEGKGSDHMRLSQLPLCTTHCSGVCAQRSKVKQLYKTES